jgi:hypothetical protein
MKNRLVDPRSRLTPYGRRIDSDRERSSFRPFVWLADHFVQAIIGTLVTLAFGGLVITQSGTTQPKPTKVKVRTKVGRVHSDSWPDGVSAWTVVLASAATRGLAEAALDQARRVPSRGLNLGILRSNDYAGLRPGYWVAFAGQFDEVGEAQETADRYRAQFASTYQRFIEEK